MKEGDVYMANEWKLSTSWKKTPKLQMVDGYAFIFNVKDKFDLNYLNSSFRLTDPNEK